MSLGSYNTSFRPSDHKDFWPRFEMGENEESICSRKVTMFPDIHIFSQMADECVIGKVLAKLYFFVGF